MSQNNCVISVVVWLVLDSSISLTDGRILVILKMYLRSREKGTNTGSLSSWSQCLGPEESYHLGMQTWCSMWRAENHSLEASPVIPRICNTGSCSQELSQESNPSFFIWHSPLNYQAECLLPHSCIFHVKLANLMISIS